ncbi:MAG: prolipoprotein diacylglyceryl transferase [Candidatus Improbicoccus devescovinae]|nr:MAG: prolipoprotein diacylglyceryl transferase [Candidatus Improbicoccus devescovinae]
MFHVSFPNLNIFIQIKPKFFDFLGISVYYYGVIISISFILGAFCVFWNFKNRNKKLYKLYNINENSLIDVLILVFITGIIGARIYYVLFSPVKFNNLKEILNIYAGGIAIYGAIISASISLFLFCKLKNINFLFILDLLVPGLLLAQSIGRWGNFFNQEAFGSATNNILAMKSEATNFELVHPCFLYESIWCLLGFIIILFIFNKKNKKNINILAIFFDHELNFYLIWYSFGRFFIESLRTDSLILKIFNKNIKISQIISLILFITLIFVLIFKNKNSSKTKSSRH